MECQAPRVNVLSYRLILALAIFSYSFLFPSSNVQADGKLRQIRTAVRKQEFKPASSSESERGGRKKSPENSRTKRDSERHHVKRHASRDTARTSHGNCHDHQSGSRGLVFISRPRPFPEPVIIPVSTGPLFPLPCNDVVQLPTLVQPERTQPFYDSVVEDQALTSVVQPTPQFIDALFTGILYRF